MKHMLNCLISGSLKILKEIVVHPDIRKAITQMGGIELMVRILADSNKHLKLHAAESLAKLAKYKKGRKIVRKNTGIPRVVDLLDVDMTKVSLQTFHQLTASTGGEQSR